MDIPEGILCSRTHSWILEVESDAVIGLTDWQTQQLGDIVFVELPEINSQYAKDEVFATIESVRGACELFMPVSGKVIEINEELINSPELINEDCFENWLVKIKPNNFQEDSEGLIEYVDYIDEVS